MKKINFILKNIIVLSTFLFLSSCRTSLDEKFYKKWMLCHLIVDNKDLLNNDLKEDKFDIPYSEATKFGIIKNPQVLIIYFDRYNYINAEYEVLNKNKIKITSCEKEEFIGEYDIILTEKQVDFPEIKAIEYNLILKSEKCSFYLKRYIPLIQ